MTENIVDVSKLSNEEVKANFMLLQKEYNNRVQQEREEIIRKIQIMAGEINMRVELFDLSSEASAAEAPAKPKRNIHPKYRNPEDQSKTWTGRGVAPLWVAEMENKGITRESMLINKPDANEPAAKKGKKD